eukprot:6185690-Pleurochrysis_carterae.AAC.1
MYLSCHATDWYMQGAQNHQSPCPDDASACIEYEGAWVERVNAGAKQPSIPTLLGDNAVYMLTCPRIACRPTSNGFRFAAEWMTNQDWRTRTLSRCVRWPVALLASARQCFPVFTFKASSRWEVCKLEMVLFISYKLYCLLNLLLASSVPATCVWFVCVGARALVSVHTCILCALSLLLLDKIEWGDLATIVTVDTRGFARSADYTGEWQRPGVSTVVSQYPDGNPNSAVSAAFGEGKSGWVPSLIADIVDTAQGNGESVGFTNELHALIRSQ